MKIILKCFTNGWRACLLDSSGNVADTTVDCYPTAEVLVSRIRESKTWFWSLEENRLPTPKEQDNLA